MIPEVALEVSRRLSAQRMTLKDPVREYRTRDPAWAGRVTGRPSVIELHFKEDDASPK